jgi:hypothetical protein
MDVRPISVQARPIAPIGEVRRVEQVTAERIAKALERIADRLDDIRDALGIDPGSLGYELGNVVHHLERIAQNPVQVSIEQPPPTNQ